VECRFSRVPVFRLILSSTTNEAGLSAEEIADIYRLKLQQVKAVIDYTLCH
jgi:uncharacterized protein (DUF433 family)